MTQEQTINDIAVKVGRLEVMQDASTKAIGDMAASVNKLVDKLDASDDVAKDADQRARSAHKRLDKMEDNQRWLWRTISGTVIAAIVAFVLAGGLKL
ncbi:hypothetical protein PAT3040_04176 [Paenibacillus agaridevorans]|uniref:Hemolysin XhlA n=1 Tax=Paenibacillus agaridevorans TaxID=171404 RepID=A0A2R5ES42_9BACL|nr:hemolysin XhlA family protein [Paenibacillus agaridevorans]GBG09526.1 hypothetical protein PAT3040_04176 [Paenibacillus agaridevorans]